MWFPLLGGQGEGGLQDHLRRYALAAAPGYCFD